MDNLENTPVAVICLTQEELQSLLERAAVAGAQAGIDKYESELKKNQRKRKDRRYHNTLLLLKSYRMLKLNAENSVFGRTQMNESAVDILDSMMNLYNDDIIVESIKNSATRTAIIVAHIRSMLDVFHVICERSQDSLDIRRYDIINGLYISDTLMTRKELMKKWDISEDTTYRDEKWAINQLAGYIFGIDWMY